ncbi:hypothetical protein DTO166G4_535 [Paecilomyces variotii]|nr:hypothetical protein DTO164E3_5910 [Paecilomyces variotii]KAJ9217731.1 hypothetical protein DTO166G4_535 [Paecilomyces variotii]KAJ9221906.1 hypothetical protein DTO169C6_5700 [Paecilomyces variotii]KAJ9229731.1 hypothetical protein DTO169E5_8742 [Paecilomyces variotii]KAJ9237268.1 hypothetical protein DTO166G5_3664 [Paecilomyces variotii]
MRESMRLAGSRLPLAAAESSATHTKTSPAQLHRDFLQPSPHPQGTSAKMRAKWRKKRVRRLKRKRRKVRARSK